MFCVIFPKNEFAGYYTLLKSLDIMHIFAINKFVKQS